MPMLACSQPGVYADALTKGRSYEVLDDSRPGQVKVLGDNGRARWFPDYCFAPPDEPISTLVRWWFEHDGIEGCADPATKNEMIEDVEFELSDGSYRGCTIATPEALKALLGEPYNPGRWFPNLLVVRDMDRETVGAMLKELDDEDELVKASYPMS